MKLSDAIVMGDSLRERCDYNWLGPGCGCALGGAVLAMGETFDGYLGAMKAAMRAGTGFTHKEATVWLQRWWPWITEDAVTTISKKFVGVCNGALTFEQLVEYVRSIEPDEEVVAEEVEYEEALA